MKTVQVRQTIQLDARGKILGRFASDIARLLRGKHKVTFAPNKDEGDIVEVTNIRDLAYDPRKLKQKLYRHFSGYPGGLKETTLEELVAKNPEAALVHAVRGMLPNNRLRPQILKRLRILV